MLSGIKYPGPGASTDSGCLGAMKGGKWKYSPRRSTCTGYLQATNDNEKLKLLQYHSILRVHARLQFVAAVTAVALLLKSTSAGAYIVAFPHSQWRHCSRDFHVSGKCLVVRDSEAIHSRSTRPGSLGSPWGIRTSSRHETLSATAAGGGAGHDIEDCLSEVSLPTISRLGTCSQSYVD